MTKFNEFVEKVVVCLFVLRHKILWMLLQFVVYLFLHQTIWIIVHVLSYYKFSYFFQKKTNKQTNKMDISCFAFQLFKSLTRSLTHGYIIHYRM